MVGAGHLDTYFEDSGGYFGPIHLVCNLTNKWFTQCVLDGNTATLSQDVWAIMKCQIRLLTEWTHWVIMLLQL